jgi:hypothetical protein
MTNATELYALNLTEAQTLIRYSGDTTVLMQGHMGTGKSRMLKMLAEEMPSHTPCYFDCTTKDLGDITIPNVVNLTAHIEGATDDAHVRYVTNEELGVHLGKPIILMIDEYGKANPAVKNALLRLMLERKIGSYTLHKDSIVFATTNLGNEGVGDLLPAHARNRLTIIKTRKPTNVEWVEDWALNAGIDHTMLAWVTDNPQLFHSFEDYKDAKDNKFIYHPADPSRTSFVTPRSLEKASGWLKVRDKLTDKSLMAALIGTIGSEAAAHLNTYVRIADQLPSPDDIKKDPMNAKIPESASAVCMVVHRALQTIDKTWADAWMDYMGRLDKEAQNMFAMQVRRPTYKRQAEVTTNKKFTAWCMANNYVFTADKK